MLSEDEIKGFCKALHIEIVNFEPTGFGFAYLVDLSEHRLGRLSTNLLAAAAEDRPVDLATWAKVAEYADRELAYGEVLFVVAPADTHVPTSLRQERPVAMLDEPSVRAISGIPKQDAAMAEFTKLLAGQVPPSLLAPWNPTRVAVGGRFYGRDKELASLTRERDTDFAISGPRRIGKTSLMRRSVEITNRGLPREHPVAFYISCQGARDRDAVIARITDSARSSTGDPAPSTGSTDVHRLWQEVAETMNGSRLLFYLDEMDDVLLWDLDNDRALSKDLAWASENGYARFVLAGGHELARISTADRFPFSKKIATIRLGPPQEKHARRLIEEPMKDMLFRVNYETTKHVLQRSGRLPHLIHFFCWWILENFDFNEPRRRSVDPGMVDKAEKSDQFEEMVIATVYKALEDSRVEQAAFYLALGAKHFHISESLLRRNPVWARFDVRPSEVSRAVANLAIQGLLMRGEDGHYKVTSPAIADRMFAAIRDPKEEAPRALKHR